MTKCLILDRPFFLGVTLGMGRGFASLDVFVLAASFPLSKVPAWTSSLKGQVMAGRLLAGAAWPSSGAWGAMSTWELEGLATRRAGG